MIFKIVLIVLLIFVFISLGIALYHLVNNKGNSDKLIKSLSWRIGLSAGIFILLLIGQALGLIQPHGL
ncbi:MAG: twin transmembrane helix small protein [Gammaproteobacteria bacterium]|nr:twin transmembrane helix small protein [Gammaproteobacteria bacterium]